MTFSVLQYKQPKIMTFVSLREKREKFSRVFIYIECMSAMNSKIQATPNSRLEIRSLESSEFRDTIDACLKWDLILTKIQRLLKI